MANTCEALKYWNKIAANFIYDCDSLGINFSEANALKEYIIDAFNAGHDDALLTAE